MYETLRKISKMEGKNRLENINKEIRILKKVYDDFIEIAKKERERKAGNDRQKEYRRIKSESEKANIESIEKEIVELENDLRENNNKLKIEERAIKPMKIKIIEKKRILEYMKKAY